MYESRARWSTPNVCMYVMEDVYFRMHDDLMTNPYYLSTSACCYHVCGSTISSLPQEQCDGIDMTVMGRLVQGCRSVL